MKMSRTSYGFAALAGGAVLLAAYYVAGLFAVVPGIPAGVLSAIGAAAVILANSTGLVLTSRRISVNPTVLIPFIYIALVAAQPATLHWSDFHPASLLLLASTFCYLHFCAIESSTESLAGSCFLLGAAGLFVPPMLWLFPVFLLLGAGKAPSKGKCLVAALLGLVLPLLILCGIRYFQGGADAVRTMFPALWEGMSELHPGIRPFSAPTLARLLLTIAATFAAIVHIVRRLDTYKTVQARAFLRLVILAAVLGLMALLFPADSHTPCALAVCLPVTLLLNELFATPGSGRAKTALAVALILLLAAERISLFL